MKVISAIKFINTGLIIMNLSLGMKKLSIILLPLTTIFLISQGVFVSDAYAYLDPGSASIILQALVGVFIGVAITMKIYWHKLKFKFASLSRKSE